MLTFFVLELNSERLHRSSGKERESRRLVFTSSTKLDIRYFHVVVVQWQNTMYKKAWCTCIVVVLPRMKAYWFLSFSLTSPSSLTKPEFNIMNWRDTTHFDSEDDYRIRLSERQSLSTSTAVFRTTFTRTIILNQGTYFPLRKEV